MFVVSGLWHGAEWTFLLWGLLHGVYRVVGDVTLPLRDRLYGALRLDKTSRAVRMWQTAVTFFLVCFAWMFFRANNTADLLILLRQLFTAGNVVTDLGLTLSGTLTVILAVAAMVLIDRRLTLETYTQKSGAVLVRGTSLYLVWAIVFAWLILLASDGSGAFIYFQF